MSRQRFFTSLRGKKPLKGRVKPLQRGLQGAGVTEGLDVGRSSFCFHHVTLLGMDMLLIPVKDGPVGNTGCVDTGDNKCGVLTVYIWDR